MVMIVPINSDVHKAEDVAQENRREWNERGNTVPLRRLQLQHHNRNDDRDHSIAECFKPSRPHSLSARLSLTAIATALQCDAPAPPLQRPHFTPTTFNAKFVASRVRPNPNFL